MPPKGQPKKTWQPIESPVTNIPPVPPGLAEALQPPKERWVKLHMKLITWHYLNFIIRVPLSTPLSHIRDRIIEHHKGAFINIEMWKDQPHPSNVIRNLNSTVQDVFQFPSDQAEEAQGVIWYLFSPLPSECPLLLREPNLPEILNPTKPTITE